MDFCRHPELPVFHFRNWIVVTPVINIVPSRRSPEFVDSVYQDSDEEEIFFGSVSHKEQTGTFSK